MVTLDIEQGTDEWLQARVGIPTASNFDKIVTTKGELSKQSKKYMYQLAGERITGKPAESFKSGYMERGNVLEDEARDYYSLVTGNDLQSVGIAYLDESRRIGCSPDSLVNDDGGLELKCPAIHTHVEYLLKNKVPTEYFTQVQGCLYVTGREWWDFMSYYPGLKPLLVRVNRDEAFITKLKEALGSFCEELDEVVKEIS